MHLLMAFVWCGTACLGLWPYSILRFAELTVPYHDRAAASERLALFISWRECLNMLYKSIADGLTRMSLSLVGVRGSESRAQGIFNFIFLWACQGL